jgi:hypothetical protein
MDLQSATFGIDALDLTKAQICARQRRLREHAVGIHRFMDRTHVAATHQDQLVRLAASICHEQSPLKFDIRAGPETRLSSNYANTILT